jgi:DNA-binding transcriptional LysR family regulator
MLGPVPDHLEALHALDDTLAVLLPRGHSLARLSPLPLHKLGTVPLILSDEDCPFALQVLDCMARVGISPQVTARISQFELVFELVASGVGAAFVPRRLAEARSHRLVQPLPTWPAIPIHLSFAYRRGRYLSYAARAWLDMVAEPLKRRAPRAAKT